MKKIIVLLSLLITNYAFAGGSLWKCVELNRTGLDVVSAVGWEAVFADDIFSIPSGEITLYRLNNKVTQITFKIDPSGKVDPTIVDAVETSITIVPSLDEAFAKLYISQKGLTVANLSCMRL